MTKRQRWPPAPGPLAADAAQYDERLGTLAQRRGFRAYLQGRRGPRERHTTLPGLVGPEPVVGAQAPSAPRVPFFLAESPWDAEAINRRRLELLVADPTTAPHAAGVLVIDASARRPLGTGQGTPGGGGDDRPGPWPPTAHRPAHHRPTERRSPRPTWPRSSDGTGCGTGASRATRHGSRTWAGPTSWSAPTRRSADPGTASAAPSPAAGAPGSRPGRRPPRPVSWPRTLRQVRGWLAPWMFLWRCWHAWSNAPPPPELRALLDPVGHGHPLDL